MNFIKQQKNYKPNKFYLNFFLQSYWFIPSDVLQRSMEANIWRLCTFKGPILDIGIGNGQLSNFLFRDHPMIDVGIDIDESGLEEARATNKYKKVLCASAEKMPFEDSSFNSIVSNSTFEHIAHDIQAVSEVGRVLKKNGLFFLTVPSAYLQKWVLEYEEKKNKKRAKEKLNSFNKRTHHLHYRSYEQWEKIFQDNNMDIVFFKYFFQKDVALLWYVLLIICTTKIYKRELWSYLAHSRLTHYLPKAFIKKILEIKVLKNAYEKGFFVNHGTGAQLFIIGKKR